MSYIKSFIKRGLLGIMVGVFINQLVYFIIATQGKVIQIESSTIISQFIISSLFGFYSCGISIIFDIEEWSLLKQTVIHSIASLPFFPVAFYAGWMPVSLVGGILFVLIYILIYLIIWFAIKSYWHKKTIELNKELKRWNS